jgi:hypothetical protein
LLKIEDGAVDIQGYKMDLSVDLSVIVTALIDKAGFDKKLIRRCVNIGIRESGKSNTWEDADDKD